MENGINQIIKDTKGRIILKKDQVAKEGEAITLSELLGSV